MDENNQIVRVMEDHQARLNITYAGQNGDMRDPVPYDASEADILRWCTEAVRNGDVPGLGAHPDVDFRDFKIDRFGPTETRDHNLIQIRPKVPFGGLFDKLAKAQTPEEADSAIVEAGPEGIRAELANDPQFIGMTANARAAKTSELIAMLINVTMGQIQDPKLAAIIAFSAADELDRRIPTHNIVTVPA